MKRTAAFPSVVALASLTLVSCDDELPIQPGSEETPSLAISDGTRGGNEHFYFLPPLVRPPEFSGVFDPTSEPVVEVCAVAEGECAPGVPPVVVFTLEGPEHERVSLHAEAEAFGVDWDTDRYELDLATIYRVRVLVGGIELGFADVQLAGSRDEFRSIDRHEYVPLGLDHALPIRFRIEEGAVTVPTARFTVGGAFQARSATTFDGSASSEPAGGPLSHSWDFGDGKRGGGAQVAHIYTAAGDYTVTLVVTTEEGVSDATTEVVSISPPPPPVGMATLSGVVRSTSGEALAGVSVELLGEGANGTTDGDGEVTLGGVGTGISATLRLTRSGFVEQFVEVTIPGGVTSASFEAAMSPRDAAVALPTVEAGGEVMGRNGVKVELPAAALVDGDGTPVVGTVDVELTPIDVTQPNAGGFPGGFSAVESDGTESELLSYGVAEFVVSQGGEEVELGLGKTATIEIPIYTGGVALGDEIPLWSLDETTGMWVEEGIGTVVFSDLSETGFALRAEVTHFSWWNIDITMDPFLPFVTCESGGVGVECSVIGTVIDPSSPMRAAYDVIPSEGKTLNSPSNVAILIEATALGGAVNGSIVINGAPGETPAVVIVLGEPYLATVECVDDVGTSLQCAVTGTDPGGAQVLFETVPVGGRDLALPPDVDVTLRGIALSGESGEVVTQGAAGTTAPAEILINEAFTPRLRCQLASGAFTTCFASWFIPGVGPFSQYISILGRNIVLPPGVNVLVTGVGAISQVKGTVLVNGAAGESPLTIIVLDDPSDVLCGGTPNSFAVVTVSVTDYCTAPDIVANVAEAISLVQPDGIVQFVSGESPNFKVASVVVDKPVTFQSADAGLPVIEAIGQQGFSVNAVPAGTVTFTGLSFIGGNFAAIAAGGTYDQVVIENSSFVVTATSGVFGGNPAVAGARVTVRNNSFTYGSGGFLGVFGSGSISNQTGPTIDIIDNVSTGPSNWGAFQFQAFGTGLIQGNTATDCGQVGCINALSAPGVVISGNTITAAVGLGVSRGIRVSPALGLGATVADNVIQGEGPVGDPTSPSSYGFDVAGIDLLGGDGASVITVGGNTIVGAAEGIRYGTGSGVTGSDNTIDNVLTGLGGSFGSGTFSGNDVTGYVSPFTISFGPGALTCNWWGDAVGPVFQNPGQPGVDRTNLNGAYALVSPVGFTQLMQGGAPTPAPEQAAYAFQREWNGAVWNDVLRIQIPSTDPATTLQITATLDGSTVLDFEATLDPGVWNGFVLGLSNDQSPLVLTPSDVFTPWATAPIANGAGGLCDGM